MGETTCVLISLAIQSCETTCWIILYMNLFGWRTYEYSWFLFSQLNNYMNQTKWRIYDIVCGCLLVSQFPIDHICAYVYAVYLFMVQGSVNAALFGSSLLISYVNFVIYFMELNTGRKICLKANVYPDKQLCQSDWLKNLSNSTCVCVTTSMNQTG